MKTIRYFFLFLLPALFLASCSGPLQIEKRHYRNGWYASNGRTHEKPAAVTAAVTEAPTTVAGKNTSAVDAPAQPVAAEEQTPVVQPVSNVPAAPAKPILRAVEKIKTKPAIVPLLTREKTVAADSSKSEKSIRRTAIASLVLGIVAVAAVALSPVIFASTFTAGVIVLGVGVIACALFAIFLGRDVLAATKRGDSARKMAITGRVLGFVVVFGLGLGLLAVLILSLLWGF